MRTIVLVQPAKSRLDDLLSDLPRRHVVYRLLLFLFLSPGVRFLPVALLPVIVEVVQQPDDIVVDLRKALPIVPALVESYVQICLHFLG